ncbi:DUF6178 family protein [Labilithrix luteola]|nr:DUF6178 family protein [Labilithrix luteola]
MRKFRAPTPKALLARILDRRDLVTAVRELPPSGLARLIDHVGLEDAGEIVALATTEQLEGVFDEDLWRNERPGEDETFDEERFAVWLEILLEAGEEFTADRLASMPEDFVTMAVHRAALVVDIDELAVEMAERGEYDDDRDLTEKALESSLYQEIDNYRLIARQHEGWDALVTVLLALDTNHRALFERILERCAAMASRYIEENGGLYEVLSSEEMLEADVAGDRDDRRAGQGFVSPSSAKSFLALARLPLAKTGEVDAVTKAYFRDLDRAPKAAPKRTEEGESLGRLVAALEEAEVIASEPERKPRAKLEGRSAKLTGEPLVREVLATLQATEPNLYGERLEELAYLVNVLVAGCAFEGRRFRPSEAADAVVAVCSLGLEDSLDSSLREPRSLVRAFRVGFHRLHRDVALAIATALERRLTNLPRAHRVLRSALESGKTWTILSVLDDLVDVWDEPTRETLAGLLDECPHRSGKLAEEPPFIASKATLKLVASFAKTL